MEQGSFLGRYQLQREIGSGSMGVVYEAWDDKLKRKVAVKTILKSQLQDPQVAAEYSGRFIQEAQNAGQLIHPNIVTVFDFGNEADVAYLVMELIHGKELKTYLDDGHVFGIGEAVVIVCQLLEALDYVHGKRIFHRDIKPANVMLESATNRVRLTDFGVARMSTSGRDGTRTGTMVGTPSYMSPEQIKGLPAGAAADLFATAVLLYQCLTLRKPFSGNGDWEIWQKIISEDPLPMASYRPDIPQALEQAVRHALAKDPLARPASARAMIDELKNAVGSAAFDPDATRVVPDGSLHLPAGDLSSLHASRPGSHFGPGLSDGDTTSGGQVTQVDAMELEFWRTIKDSTDPEEFALYLARYPNGHYAGLAQRKMAKLGSGQPGAATVLDTTGGGDADEAAQRRMREAEARERQEAEARRQAEEELARQRVQKLAEEAARVAEELAARKAAAEDAARKAAEEAAIKAAEEAAIKAAEEVAHKAAAEEAWRKAAEEAAIQAAQEAARKAAADEAARIAAEERIAARREARRKAAARKKEARKAALARAKAEAERIKAMSEAAAPPKLSPHRPVSSPGEGHRPAHLAIQEEAEAQASPATVIDSLNAMLINVWWKGRHLPSSGMGRMALIGVIGVLAGFGLVLAIST
jgi:serine/threonine-protein kinase